MFTEKLKELEAARAKLAALEAQITTDRNRELASLPAKYGFQDSSSFMEAVVKATGGRVKRQFSGEKSRGVQGRRRRAKITDAIRTQVKKLVEAGTTGIEIAKQLEISLPTVQNIKKALGLVKKSKK